MRKYPILSVIVGCLIATTATAATPDTPFPLGLYVGNASVDDPAAMAAFKTAFDAHNAILGAKPQYFDIFTDNRRDPSTWAASAQFSVASATKSGSAYLAASSGIIPVVGVPMAWNELGYDKADQFYTNTIAGDYDSVWTGIVDAWADGGYKTVDFRLGYEMNGNYMSWSPGNSQNPLVGQLFVAAFQHIADILHTVGAERGIDSVIHWDPTAINYTNYSVTSLYPGDKYVDVIGVDQYNNMYPRDLTDWRTPDHQQMNSYAEWVAVPENREHYFLYPNASQYTPTPSLDDYGWSLPQTIELAALHDKPIAIDETGVGPSGSSIGLADDPLFPQYLATTLASAEAQGVTVRQVNIWDTTQSDGDWNFQNGSKPLTAAAWRQYFGAGGVAAVPEPASWVMLVVGFGLVGCQAQRRPTATLAA